MCYQEGMVTENLRNLDLGIQWEQVLLMFDQVGVGRDIHW